MSHDFTATLPPKAVLLRSALDEPRSNGQVVRGTNAFRGWVLHPFRPVESVEIWVDGAPVASTGEFVHRADVERAHRDYPGAEHAGWECVVELREHRGDAVRIEVVATLGMLAGEGGAPRGGSTLRRSFQQRSFVFGTSSGSSGVGRIDAPLHSQGGYQRIAGVADSPSGVSCVELIVDGEVRDRARLVLPGPALSDPRRPESAMAGFEGMVHLPDGGTDPEVATDVRIGIRVHPREGQPYHLHDAVVRVAGPEWADSSWPAQEMVEAAAARNRRRTAETARRRAEPGAGPPRVLLLTHHLGLGGAQLYLQELVRRLHRRGVRGAVVSFVGGVLEEELAELGFPVLVTGNPDVVDPQAYEELVESVAAFATLHECEVALANTTLTFAGIDAAHRVGIPVAWAIHESFPLGEYWIAAYGRLPHPHVDARARETLRRAERVVFEADATRSLYEPLLQPGASVVVPYGVDTSDIDAYRATNSSAEIRERLGIPASALVLLCLGTLEPRKGQAALAVAAARSAELAAADACLILVGAREGDPYTQHVQDLALGFAELGVRLQIRVEPVQPDTYQWYAAADVLVCASDVESLPRSMLEAMTFETAVVSTSVFGVPELVTDGETGLLCSVRDPDALQECLERAARLGRGRLAEIGRAGSALVRTKHDPSVYEEYFSNTLAELAGRPCTLSRT